MAAVVVASGYRGVAAPAMPSILGDITTLIDEQPTVTPTIIPSATPIPHTITIVDAPTAVKEDDRVPFTWAINGPPTIIPSTTIYYGVQSTPGVLTRQANPESTRYTMAIGDFLQGEYAVPLQFIASIPNIAPGTYYYRGYAKIDGKHYWTEEKSFEAQKTPKHMISVIDYPKTQLPVIDAPFTWEISGPDSQTSFTTIVAGKTTKPGPLDENTTIPMTPYTVVISDFTQGMMKVPLRFVGNAHFSETGTYYFRALTYINGKNIWSEEYSLVVQ